ncbi:hypothetical protein GH5_00154 [Leishmania sp. Ghana 2012 LV757]|uniref:hypothetical protein n=1 Tax=Leishmania sp. Ghana 2012 LV757 TaxID=2803181 RepID=UPI001B4AFBC2|nr:hypothetical protein GH5_00154 [Leishmania sp. Ghana 2012 LV757]
MPSSKACDNAVDCKKSSPAPKLHRSQASFSDPAPSARAADILVSPQESDARRVRESSIRVVGSDAPEATSDHKQAGAATALSDYARPDSPEVRVLGAAARAMKASAAPASLPRGASKLAGRTVAGLSQRPARPMPSPSLSLAPTLISILQTGASAPNIDGGATKFFTSVGVSTLGTHGATIYSPTTAATSSNRVSCTGASHSSATSEQPAQTDCMAPLCRVASAVSFASTISSSDSQMSNHSFTVFSVRYSPPLHPCGPAPMKAKIGPAQPDQRQRVTAERLSPLNHPIDKVHVAIRSDLDETGSFTYVAPLPAALHADRLTRPADVAVEHPSPPPLMHVARMATVEQSARCCFSTSSAPEANVLPSTGEVLTGPFTAISSSAGLPFSCSTDSRLSVDASLQLPAYDMFLCTDVTRIRPFAPFAHRSTTPSRESCASPQGLPEDQSRWDSISAAGRRRRDSPRTHRMHSTSHEWSHTGCFTSSSNAWDGRLRSASADRGSSLRSALSAKMPIFSSQHRTTPSPPNASAPRSLFSTALNPVFLTTVLRFKYKLLDGSTATLTPASAKRDNITDQLAMEQRLSCLKWEMTRQRMRRRRGGHVGTL